MNHVFPYGWVLPAWAAVVAVYFLTANLYLWRKLGTKRWMALVGSGNRQRELRFAGAIREFPGWYLGYQTIKWGTLAVAIGYFVWIFIYLLRRH